MGQREKSVHINLEKLARKIIASPPKDGSVSFALSESGFDALLNQLRRERLEQTDYEFRRRYSHWL